MITIDADSPHRAVWDDPIVAEVRAAREAIAAEFDYDVERIARHVAVWSADWRHDQENSPEPLADTSE